MGGGCGGRPWYPPWMGLGEYVRFAGGPKSCEGCLLGDAYDG